MHRRRPWNAGALGVVGVLGRCSRDTAESADRPAAQGDGEFLAPTCKPLCSSLRRLCSLRSHSSLVLQMWELQNLAGRRLVLQKMWELQRTGLDGVQTAQEALDGLTRVCVCVTIPVRWSVSCNIDLIWGSWKATPRDFVFAAFGSRSPYVHALAFSRSCACIGILSLSFSCALAFSSDRFATPPPRKLLETNLGTHRPYTMAGCKCIILVFYRDKLHNPRLPTLRFV